MPLPWETLAAPRTRWDSLLGGCGPGRWKVLSEHPDGLPHRPSSFFPFLPSPTKQIDLACLLMTFPRGRAFLNEK